MGLGIALMAAGVLEFTLAAAVFDVPFDLKIFWLQTAIALFVLGAGLCIRGFIRARPRHVV